MKESCVTAKFWTLFVKQNSTTVISFCTITTKLFIINISPVLHTDNSSQFPITSSFWGGLQLHLLKQTKNPFPPNLTYLRPCTANHYGAQIPAGNEWNHILRWIHNNSRNCYSQSIINSPILDSNNEFLISRSYKRIINVSNITWSIRTCRLPCRMEKGSDLVLTVILHRVPEVTFPRTYKLRNSEKLHNEIYLLV
jgi:hypothetical protein